MLSKQHERTFPQIVRSCLERQTDHSNAPLTAPEYLRNCMIDMRTVRLHDARVHRQVYVAHFRHVCGGAQIFGKTRAAESKPRPEVGWRDVELPILTYEIHYFEGIDTERFA